MAAVGRSGLMGIAEVLERLNQGLQTLSQDRGVFRWPSLAFRR